LQGVDKFGTKAIFGTQENFERYRLTDVLRSKADALRDRTRLILMGFTPSSHDQGPTHALLNELRIPHEYRDEPPREHNWHSGWVAEAVDLLLPDPLPRSLQRDGGSE
jgi:hypothetical protein